MIALYILIGIALIIFIFLMLWVKVTVYFKDDLTYTAKLGPFTLDLEKDTDEEKSKDQKKKSKKNTEDGKMQKKENQTFSSKELYNAVFDLFGILKDFLSKYSNTLHFYAAKFYIKIGTEDAATTALECATIKSIVACAFDFINSFAIIDKGCEKNVKIIPDFTSSVSECDIKIIFKTRLASLIRTLFTLFYRYIKKTVKREISELEKGQQQ